MCVALPNWNKLSRSCGLLWFVWRGVKLYYENDLLFSSGTPASSKHIPLCSNTKYKFPRFSTDAHIVHVPQAGSSRGSPMSHQQLTAIQDKDDLSWNINVWSKRESCLSMSLEAQAELTVFLHVAHKGGPFMALILFNGSIGCTRSWYLCTYRLTNEICRYLWNWQERKVIHGKIGQSGFSSKLCYKRK